MVFSVDRVVVRAADRRGPVGTAHPLRTTGQRRGRRLRGAVAEKMARRAAFSAVRRFRGT
jgi:hypothetical protein